MRQETREKMRERERHTENEKRRAPDIDRWLSEEHANRRRHLNAELDHYSSCLFEKQIPINI